MDDSSGLVTIRRQPPRKRKEPIVSAIPVRNQIAQLPLAAAWPLAGVSVVLPAHNEEENVIEAIRQAIAATEAWSARQEVIVVDDGSIDATGALARQLSSFEPRVRVVSHDRNRGYGSAIRTGIAAAQLEWLLLTDADLQFDLGQLCEFVPHTCEAELVVGYRKERSDPLLRRVNARGWNALIHLLFRLQVRDVDCAFKLIRRDMLDGVELISTGATIDTEILATARRRGAHCVELPVTHRARVAGEASGANLCVIGRAFRELLTVWRHVHEPDAPQLPLASHQLAA
jgi:glycosyltransferase involved in cell wall biosynthesis